MARKSWFSLLRRFLNIAETQPKPHKERRRRWAFGRLKIQSLPSLSRERSVSEAEAEQEQSKHAVTVAIATAAAAAAEQDFAEVVRLNGIPQTLHQSEEETQEFAAIKIQASEKEFQDVSATKIQAVFRGYLARKALRALRGLVRLQAIIRGRAVRRQAITTLKCLQSVVNIQSQVCARRIQMVEGTWDLHENKQLQDFKDKVVKIDSNSQKRWDDSILSKDEANALFFSKRVAVVKRERINEYLLNHRRSAESEQSRANGRRRYWLEQWVDTQLSKNSDTVFPSNARIRKEYGVGGGQLKLRNSHVEGLDSPVTAPRRSFHHKKQRSVGDDNGFGFASSPVVPTYMAATESAKAKARSTSSPRQRPASLDAYSETNSPYKHKLSPISSFNSEVTSSSRICNLSGFQQRSPCLKGIPGPVKSSRSLKDLSFDSECSLPNWVRNGALFR